ncbi:MAG: hypothetical protein AUJ92_21465 [Armatimonadetes bacterium CG2_30_59_28]|nr:MAG: hypothetical protein AUJ92_21465 [Armatimonadetes bacterium CG2_30_59_28]
MLLKERPAAHGRNSCDLIGKLTGQPVGKLRTVGHPCSAGASCIYLVLAYHVVYQPQGKRHIIGVGVHSWTTIIPAAVKRLHLGLPEVLIPIACFALFMVQFSTSFHKAEPAPRQYPYLGESLHMHVA